MGIWIRSQDKGLGEYIKLLPPVVEYEKIPDPEVAFCSINGKPLSVKIMGCGVFGIGDVLGNYKTGEEAAKVLDMIQKHIGDVEYGRYGGNVIYPIFEMPPAGFSEMFYPDCGGDFCGLIDPIKANAVNADSHCEHSDECKAAWDRGCR